MTDTKAKKPKRIFINKFVILDEEQLIRLVEAKPVLYDKSLKSYRKTNLRQQVWKEVAVEMGNLNAEECRKRWRSLRDSFIKHYKLSLRLEPGELSKKKKWVFYDQMKFLEPYLDKGTSDTSKVLLDYIEDDNSNSNDDSEDERKFDKIESFIKTSESFEEENSINTKEEHTTYNILTNSCEDDKTLDNILLQDGCDKSSEELGHFGSIRTNDCRANSSLDNATLDNILLQNECDKSSEEIGHFGNIRTNDCGSNGTLDNATSNTTNRTHVSNFCGNNEIAVQVSSQSYDDICTHSCSDPDEKFLLSCLPALKRLSHRKNALARLKIQKTLYEIEFDINEAHI